MNTSNPIVYFFLVFFSKLYIMIRSIEKLQYPDNDNEKTNRIIIINKDNIVSNNTLL